MSYALSDFNVGQTVRVKSNKYPGLWIVTKVNAKSCSLESTSGRGKLRASPSYLSADNLEQASAVNPLEPVKPGTVVKYSARPGLWVITKVNGETVIIWQLGGGKGIRAVPRKALTVVPLDVLGDALWTEKLNAS